MKRALLPLAVIHMKIPAKGIARSRATLVGTWRLISATDATDRGEIKDAFGKGAVGFLTYTADGRMMGIVSHGGRKPLSVNDYIAAPAAERSEAFATFIAYAGSYTRSGDTVIHHVQIASIQNWANTNLTRTIVNLQSDRLTLRTPPFLMDGKMVTTELVWERLTEKN